MTFGCHIHEIEQFVLIAIYKVVPRFVKIGPEKKLSDIVFDERATLECYGVGESKNGEYESRDRHCC